MAESMTCSRCGKPLDALAPRGVCVHCVLREGLLLPNGDLESVSGQHRADQSQNPACRAADDDDRSGDGHGPRPELAGSGTVVLARFGEYELLEEIARGGMGIVYKARQVSLNRLVALKMILSGQFASKQEVLRFRVEAEAAANLRHPNIVAIYETGEHQGQHFFSMEYVAGPNLAQLVGNRPLNAQVAARYSLAIARAIHYAHGQNTLHRDLKPSNVLVDANDQPRITDFGLMRRLRGPYGLTVTGQMLGSPSFMPPEQCGWSSNRPGADSVEPPEIQNSTSERVKRMGMSSGVAAANRKSEIANHKSRAGPWSDVYGIGAILYHLLTARPPFQAESVQDVLLQLREKDPVAPRLLNPSIPRDLETICLKCLEKDPDQRYATADEVADDLDRFLHDEPIRARPVGHAERAWRWCRRKPGLASFIAATAALLLAILIGSPIFIYRIDQAVNRSEAAELMARRDQYASDMNLAHQAVNEGDFFRALQLMERHRPSFGVPALAGSVHSPDAADRLKAGLQADLRGWEWRYLWKQCQGDQLFVLGHHSNGVTAVGVLPDGQTAYSAGNDGAVRFWDLESKRQTGLLQHDSPVAGVACSPDGRWLATATETKIEQVLGKVRGVAVSPESQLRLWDSATWTEAAVLTTNFWLRPTIVFSPDSKLLAFATTEHGIRLWSLAPRQEITNLAAYFHYTGPLGVAFSPDGQTLAYTENERGDIVVWDIRSRSVIRRLKGHSWFVRALVFTPDGQTLASGSEDRSIKLWDWAAGRERVTFTNYTGPVWRLHISPDGKTLATTAQFSGQQVTLQELGTGREVLHLRGHRDLINDAGFSRDGRTLFTGSRDGTVRVWDATARAMQPDSRQFSTGLGEFAGGSGTAVCLSPDGRHLLSVFSDYSFSVWDMKTLIESKHYRVPLSQFDCAALASGGEVAAFVARDGNVVFWHRESGETNWFGRPTIESSNRALFSRDGKRLAISGDRDLCVCDVASKTRPHNFPLRGEYAFSLAFSRDSQKIMAGCVSGIVKVWDLAGQANEVTLRGRNKEVCGLALLPDGRTLIAVGSEIRFWDVNSQRELFSFHPRPSFFKGCSISADGRRLAVGAFDGRVTVWDLDPRQEVATLKGDEGPINDVSFLPDGNTLVSVGQRQLCVWRAASLAEVDSAPGN